MPRINFDENTNELWVDLFDCEDKRVIKSLALEFSNKYETKKNNIQMA